MTELYSTDQFRKVLTIVDKEKLCKCCELLEY